MEVEVNVNESVVAIAIHDVTPKVSTFCELEKFTRRKLVCKINN